MKKTTGFYIGCGAIGLVCAGAVASLAMGLVGSVKLSSELKADQASLAELKAQVPFREESNLINEKQSVTTLRESVNEMLASFEKSTHVPEGVTKGSFPNLLDKTSRRMTRLAAENGVEVAPDFSFGFDPYLQGKIATDVQVPRLTAQLVAAEHVLSALCLAKVDVIDSISREAFETAAAPEEEEGGRRSRRNRRNREQDDAPKANNVASFQDPDKLYTYEQITVSFEADEAEVWTALMRLSMSPAFTEVVSVKTETLGTTVLDYEVVEPGESEVIRPRMDRVLAGTEKVAVTAVVNVYKFAKEIAQ